MGADAAAPALGAPEAAGPGALGVPAAGVAGAPGTSVLFDPRGNGNAYAALGYTGGAAANGVYRSTNAGANINDGTVWTAINGPTMPCNVGNPANTLPCGTAADVAAEAKEAMDIAAPGGGYILASDHSLHDGIPIENIRELARVGTAYGGQFYQR